MPPFECTGSVAVSDTVAKRSAFPWQSAIGTLNITHNAYRLARTRRAQGRLQRQLRHQPSPQPPQRRLRLQIQHQRPPHLPRHSPRSGLKVLHAHPNPDVRDAPRQEVSRRGCKRRRVTGQSLVGIEYTIVIAGVLYRGAGPNPVRFNHSHPTSSECGRCKRRQRAADAQAYLSPPTKF